MAPLVPDNMQKAVLLFIRNTGTPVILYGEDANVLYTNLSNYMKNANTASPKFIEQKGIGPVKRISFYDVDIASVALQEEMMPPDAGMSGPPSF